MKTVDSWWNVTDRLL